VATPSLIPAFDDLGPNDFARLCNALLSANYPPGSLALGGVASDAGADARVDLRFFLVLRQDAIGAGAGAGGAGAGPLPNTGKVIFQFKHVVVARAGEQNARNRVLGYYRCSESEKCELHEDGHMRLFAANQPTAYRLITNLEVTQAFRDTFIAQCTNPAHAPSPHIVNYDVMGLDELEALLQKHPNLANSFWHASYSPFQYHLLVDLDRIYRYTHIDKHGAHEREIPSFGVQLPALPAGADAITESCKVIMRNAGTAISYIDRIEFHIASLKEPNILTLNPKSSLAVQPGNACQLDIALDKVAEGMGPLAVPGSPGDKNEVRVVDKMKREYTAAIPDDMLSRIVDPEAYRMERVDNGDEWTAPTGTAFQIHRYDYRGAAAP